MSSLDLPTNTPGWGAVLLVLIGVAAGALYVAASGLLTRLRADLQRPGGGWTVGLLTLLGVFVSPAFVLVLGWLRPVGWIAMLGFLAAHLSWGSAGYYPRGMH